MKREDQKEQEPLATKREQVKREGKKTRKISSEKRTSAEKRPNKQEKL